MFLECFGSSSALNQSSDPSAELIAKTKSPGKLKELLNKEASRGGEWTSDVTRTGGPYPRTPVLSVYGSSPAGGGSPSPESQMNKIKSFCLC